MTKRSNFGKFSLILLLSVASLLAEDYRWLITFPFATNDWGKKLSSGEIKTAVRVQFIKLTPGTYKLNQFWVRPTTTFASWVIDSVQLWQNTDDYPGSLDRNQDLLVSSKPVNIAVQSSPTDQIRFTVPDNYILEDTTTFFVTMVVHNWRDANPTNIEISNQNGAAVGLAINDNDLGIDNGTPNNYATSSGNIFTVRALNLPVTIHNKNQSTLEDDVHFFPNYTPLNGTTVSKSEILSDLHFSAYVLIDTNAANYKMTYTSLYIGWDNTILRLDSLYYGDAWNGKEFHDDGSGFGVISGGSQTNYSVVRFEGIVVDTINYVSIANKYLAVLDFTVLKPGISPLFLSDITIHDEWGIPYHVYRKTTNATTAATPKNDAWAKFILGDFAGNPDALTNGQCDAEVDAMTDISLFSNYLWLSPDSANWYSRFDVGSRFSHDPDALVPDDTTNFYDLMVIGTNYYRSYTGAFNQKAVVSQPQAVQIYLSEVEQSQDKLISLQLAVAGIRDLTSAQCKLRFDPRALIFRNAEPGSLIRAHAPQTVQFLHIPSLNDGVVDISLLALPQTINGNGVLLTLNFEVQESAMIRPFLESIEMYSSTGALIPAQVEKSVLLPTKFKTLQAYPNPFNPSTTLEFRLRDNEAGHYRLQIFDLRGQCLRTISEAYYPAGIYRYQWDGTDSRGVPATAGIYLVALKAEHNQFYNKIILLR